jgi:hypothetical protein
MKRTSPASTRSRPTRRRIVFDARRFSDLASTGFESAPPSLRSCSRSNPFARQPRDRHPARRTELLGERATWRCSIPASASPGPAAASHSDLIRRSAALVYTGGAVALIVVAGLLAVHTLPTPGGRHGAAQLRDRRDEHIHVAPSWITSASAT